MIKESCEKCVSFQTCWVQDRLQIMKEVTPREKILEDTANACEKYARNSNIHPRTDGKTGEIRPVQQSVSRWNEVFKGGTQGSWIL